MFLNLLPKTETPEGIIIMPIPANDNNNNPNNPSIFVRIRATIIRIEGERGETNNNDISELEIVLANLREYLDEMLRYAKIRGETESSSIFDEVEDSDEDSDDDDGKFNWKAETYARNENLKGVTIPEGWNWRLA